MKADTDRAERACRPVMCLHGWVAGVVGVHQAYHRSKRASLAARALRDLLQDHEDAVRSFRRALGGWKEAKVEAEEREAEEQEGRLRGLRKEFDGLVHLIRSTALDL